MINQITERPLTIEQLRQIQRDLYELSKPFVEAKCCVLSVSLPGYIRHPDGRFEVMYDQETTEMLARYDQLWADARDQYIARHQGLFCGLEFSVHERQSVCILPKGHSGEHYGE